METNETTIRILSIDAWRDGPSWTWNNWFHVASIERDELPKGTRSILRMLRERGMLTDRSKGRVAIEDDQYNLVIIEKGNRRPLFAIEYGASV